MNAVIKGAKAGEQKARKAVIAPDSAQSKTYIKILYGLSEGEVEGLANGLQSVYLEETPLQNPTGGWNFEDVQADFRHFLNGVCRHEHIDRFRCDDLKFLNGVCRHERTARNSHCIF